MIRIKHLKEKFLSMNKFNNFYIHNSIVQFYINPNQKEIKNIFQEFSKDWIRGVILNNGFLIIWDQSLLHHDAIPYLKNVEQMKNYDLNKRNLIRIEIYKNYEIEIEDDISNISNFKNSILQKILKNFPFLKFSSQSIKFINSF